MKKSTILIVITGLLMAGCGKSNSSGDDGTVVTVETLRAGSNPNGTGHNYSATIEEMNGSTLSFATMGTVSKILVHEGQMVSKGQLIALVEATKQSNAVTANKAQTQSAKDALEQAQDYYDRMKVLHENGSLPDVRWVDAQTKLKQAQSGMKAAEAQTNISRKSLGDTHLYAPFAGYVSEKMVDEGVSVGPGVPVIKLVNIEHVKCKISVPEEEISSMQIGREVQVTVSALGGQTFVGRIAEKGVSADPVSRSYDVKVVLNNESHRLLPGMVATATPVIGAESGNVVTLPVRLIQIDEQNNRFVWTVRGGKAHKNIVTLSSTSGNNVIVTDGLQRGEEVISDGAQKVSEGMAVKTHTKAA